MPVLQAPNLDIFYQRGGQPDGPTLLFISGSGGDLRNKPNQFDSPLAEHFDLISYDQRGLGQSGKPPGAYSMVQYADDAAALLDHLGLARVLVMGVSFGGMVGQEFALRHPQRIAALVLACTSSGGAGRPSYPLHELQDLPPRERAAAHLKIADTMHTDAWISEHPQAWEQRLELSLGGTKSKAEINKEELEGAHKQLQARRFHDTYARLPTLKMPVLLAGGERDGIAPVANMQAIQRQIPHSTLQLFAGGHMFLIQDKQAYPYIIQWFKDVLANAG